MKHILLAIVAMTGGGTAAAQTLLTPSFRIETVTEGGDPIVRQGRKVLVEEHGEWQ